MYAYPGDSRLIDVKTEGLNACGIVRKEGLSIPVRAPCLSDGVRKGLELSVQMFVIV